MRSILSWILQIFLVVSFVLGCATSSTHKENGVEKRDPPPSVNLLPPNFQISSEKDVESVDYFLLKSLETSKERNFQWWIRYKRGMIWAERKPNLSCEQFSLLAKEPLFPLASVAYLKAMQVCPKTSEHLQSFAPLDPKTLPRWQKHLGLESAIRRAELDSEFETLMNLSYEKSKLPMSKAAKVEWSEKAQSLAQSLGKKGFENKMRKRIEGLRPSRLQNPKRSQWLNVAYDYRRLRNFSLANNFYQKVIRNKRFSFKNKLKAYKGLRKSYKNNRQMDKYLNTTLKMALFVEKKFRRNQRSSYYRRLFHDNFITLARTQWTLGEVKKANRTLNIIKKTLRKKYPLAEVYWLLGRMAEEKKNFNSAVYWFETALKETISSDEFREKISWYLAWNFKKLGKFQSAQETLDRLIDSTQNDFAKSKYRFWLAKTMRDSGDDVNAQLTFQTLINEDPLGYYGLVAHHLTNQRIPASQAPPKYKPRILEKSKEAKEKISAFADLQVLDWLISLEEHELAKTYLNSISAQYRKRSDQEEELVWLEIFNYYGEAGEYLSLFEQLGKLSPERRKFILDENPSLIFPTPFKDLVTAASENSGIQAELIYSIMRQESAFNPRARSFADAYGLLQMLPENAAKEPIAKTLSYSKADDLYKPEVNIPIGASFLRKISDKWNNQFILLVASYNANDRAIRGWIRTRFRGDSLEFIEDIPYEETRGYIRLVMRNLIFYSLLAADGEKISFPGELLKLDFPLDSTQQPLKEASL